MIRPEVLDAMLAAGCSAEQIASAVKASIKADEADAEARRAAKREGNAERQRRFRNARNALSRVTERDSALPPHPPETRVSPEPPSQTHTPHSDPKGSSLPPGRCETGEREVELRKALVAAFEEARTLPPPMHAVVGWLERGYDPDMIREVVVAGVRRGIRTLTYFDQPLAKEHARMLTERARPPPEIIPSQPSTITPLRPRHEPTSVIEIGRAIAARPPPGYGR